MHINYWGEKNNSIAHDDLLDQDFNLIPNDGFTNSISHVFFYYLLGICICYCCIKKIFFV